MEPAEWSSLNTPAGPRSQTSRTAATIAGAEPSTRRRRDGFGISRLGTRAVPLLHVPCPNPQIPKDRNTRTLRATTDGSATTSRPVPKSDVQSDYQHRPRSHSPTDSAQVTRVLVEIHEQTRTYDNAQHQPCDVPHHRSPFSHRGSLAVYRSIRRQGECPARPGCCIAIDENPPARSHLDELNSNEAPISHFENSRVRAAANSLPSFELDRRQIQPAALHKLINELYIDFMHEFLAIPLLRRGASEDDPCRSNDDSSSNGKPSR